MKSDQRRKRKTAVEECISISSKTIENIIKQYHLIPYFPILGKFEIKNKITGNLRASLSFAILVEKKILNIFYITGSLKSAITIEDIIHFETTSHMLGKNRFNKTWLICSKCGKRNEKLYLPPNEFYFECRSCHNLNYISSQESHRFDSIYKAEAERMGLDFKTAKTILEASY